MLCTKSVSSSSESSKTSMTTLCDDFFVDNVGGDGSGDGVDGDGFGGDGLGRLGDDVTFLALGKLCLEDKFTTAFDVLSTTSLCSFFCVVEMRLFLSLN